MSFLAQERRFAECPDVIRAITPHVSWVMENNHWYVHIMIHKENPNGRETPETVYIGHFTRAEAMNAYQALMLGLSAWRHSG